MFELIPAIDVLDGQVVRLERGSFDSVTVYAADPGAVAASFVAAGAPLVHVVDLNGARFGSPDADLRRKLAEKGVAFQIGGGLRSAADVAAAVADGATRVVAGTTAVWDPAELGAMVAAVGPDRLVAAVDVSAGRAKGSGWLDDGRPISQVLDDLAAGGVRRVLTTAISRDGMLAGPDLDLLDEVAAAGFDVIASGGVSSLEDVCAIVSRGYAGAIVGKAIYEKRFSVAEALAAIAAMA